MQCRNTIYYHIYSKYFVEFNFIIKHAIEKKEYMFWLLVKIQIIAHSSCSFRPHDVCLHYLMLKVYSLHKNRVGNIVSCLILYKNLSWILYSYSLAFVIYTAFKYTNKERYNKDLLHISKTCNYLLTYLCINACSFLRSRSRNFEHIILYILGCKKQNSGKNIHLMVCCDIIRFYDYLLLKFYQQHECVICVTYYKSMNTM